MPRMLIRVSAEMSDEMLAPYPHHTPPVQATQTTLTGAVHDQGELQGILNYLSGLGIGIVEVVTIPDDV